MTNWRDILKQKPVKLPLVLPEEILLLEMDSVILLPKGQLPLQLTPRQTPIFYQALGADRLVGVVQVAKEDENNPVLFKTGCLGRIVAFSENEDAEPFVIVVGLARFEILEEKTGPYGTKHAKVCYKPYAFDAFEADETLVENRDHFLSTVRSYCQSLDVHPNWDEVLKSSDENLVTALTMMCPFEAHEKQALLETTTLQDRARVLAALMELACLKKDVPLGGFMN